ncbi:TetR/AcrR family transcriptional regulator [Sneathiella aquimaris]|uniref:TetR/AcrR family transcriptional regulator n=1 Tax=Sneathiella aquimaris TaxID=2599305 RepID=UPI00146A4B71|nr:TetR/AcrR family transcriptional regulator [Sneathiella aquimaris]
MSRQNANLNRSKILQTAIRLFRRQGYAATGLQEILAVSKAPKGSLYYYFPKGKEELAAAAIHAAGKRVTATLQTIENKTSTTEGFLIAYSDQLAHWMALSGYKDGCPISTVLLEQTPGSPLITAAGQASFAEWKKILYRILARDGLKHDKAMEQTDIIMSMIQGAILLSRVEQSARPLESIGQYKIPS